MHSLSNRVGEKAFFEENENDITFLFRKNLQNPRDLRRFP